MADLNEVTPGAASPLDDIETEFAEDEPAVPRVVRTDTRTRVTEARPKAKPAAEEQGDEPDFDDELTADIHELAVYLRETKADREAFRFVQSHPEYMPTPENYKTLQSYLNENELPMTVQNLEAAFEELSEAGALQVAKRKAPTGLSDRSSHRVQQRDTVEEDVEAIQNLPIEEARSRLLTRLHQLKTARR